MAPTKPLVAQQIIACHETCGIPGGDSIELNGEVPKATRARHVSFFYPLLRHSNADHVIVEGKARFFHDSSNTHE